MNGHDLIRAERIRQQQSENYTLEGDRERVFELAIAAARYAENAGTRYEYGFNAYEDAPNDWPWPDKTWKPKTTQRDLVRAGALIAAALDALQAEDE